MTTDPSGINWYTPKYPNVLFLSGPKMSPEDFDFLDEVFLAAVQSYQEAAGVVVTKYEIRDEGNKVYATKVRRDFADGRPKELSWERKGEAGLGGLKPESLPLYGTENLNGMAGAFGFVVLTEGEKAAQALLHLNVPPVQH